jgi:hypothetical protein
VLALEVRVLAYLKADATLTALCPAAHMTAGEVWTLPLDALYPHISFAAIGDHDAGLASEPVPRALTLQFWCESMESRFEAKSISDRIFQMFHRQQVAISDSTVSVYKCIARDGAIPVRDPKTGANQISLRFDVVASS